MKHILLLFVFLILFIEAKPQKVGLVLSGGGAKGLAHIGLLKVLEDHNIPIDYVAGTSIGAIIAGLYAAGYTPDEMLELFNSDDFKLWSTGKVNKESLYYFKQKDEFPEWMKVDVAKKKEKFKLILPINIVPERQIDFAFMQMFSQITAVCDRDFNKLMVPFRCVSTDIVHNKAIIHCDGDLGEAIRASMTFPMVYKPIEKDGVLLFDGGIENNFPTDVMANEFAPDIIIGHKVSDDDEIPDPDDLFKQIESLVMQQTNYEIPDSEGILIETKLSDVGLLDFPKVNYVYSRGIESALHNIDSIEHMITRRVSKEELSKKRADFIKKKPELKFNNIQVEGISDNQQRKYIIQSIKDKDSDVITLEQLRDSYFKLISDEHIKSVRPTARYNKMTGLFDLNLKVEPRKPLDLALGGNVTTRSNSFGFLQANYKIFKGRSYTLTNNLYLGRFYNSFLIGGRMDTPTRKPFYLSGYFTHSIWDYLTTSSDLIFSDIRPSYVLRNERNLRFEAGIPYTNTSVITMGLALSKSLDKYYQTKVFNQSDKLDATRFDSYIASLAFNKKEFDFKQYPTEGSSKMLGLYYVTGTEHFSPGTTSPITESYTGGHSYFQMKAQIEKYFILSKRARIGLYGEAVFNNNTLFNNYLAATLLAPAFTPTPNSKSIFLEQFTANHYLAPGVKGVYKLGDYLHARVEAYGFFPVQTIEAGDLNTAKYSKQLFSDWRPMGMAALVFQTNVGPLSVEINYYDKTGQKFFFSINMGYMLLNKRGL